MNRIALIRGAVATICIMLFSSVIVCSASSTVILKKGMRGTEVTSLQNDLKKLGYFNTNSTGYFGNITTTSVKTLQKKYGYSVDGIVGKNTFALLDQLTGRTADRTTSKSTTSSRASTGDRSSAKLLKKGMRGAEVEKLQANLKKIGYFDVDVTGYYGDITVASVKELQKNYGYIVDGIVGEKTYSLLGKLLEDPKSAAKAKPAETGTSSKADTGTSSRSSSERVNYMPKWFGGAENIFKIGSTATVYDIDSGLSFKIKRTYGHNHADCEPLTKADTNTMKKIYGGSWSWTRRAIIIDVGGRKLAASMAGMPHAGVDSVAANKTVSSRSGGYGKGTNLDTVKNNEMNGHFDVHFYQSKTHGTQKVNAQHQAAVKKANEWAKKNY